MKKAKFKKNDNVLIKGTIKGVVIDIEYDSARDLFYYRCEPLENIERYIHTNCGVVDFIDVYRPEYHLRKIV